MPYDSRYPATRLLPSQPDLMVVEFSEQCVLSRDVASALKTLSPLFNSRENTERHEGVLSFCFPEWDADPRETPDIPEIRAFFAGLTHEFPYWLHFAEKQGDTLMHVIRLLCRGHAESVQGGTVVWRFDDPAEIGEVILDLFSGMRELHSRWGLPSEATHRISQEVAHLVERALA